MSALNNPIGVVVLVLALLASVILHEAGHFFTAKAFGMKATQFFVGFGPTLFSRKRGETEYGIKAIPAGGFVKIIGMTPLEEVDPADQKRAFFRQPTPQRVIVLSAGSLMHFVIALLLATGVAFFAPSDNPGVRIESVSSCLPVDERGLDDQQLTALETPAKDGSCPTGAVQAPAAAAGLEPGDVVLSVNSTTLGTVEDNNPADAVLTSTVRASTTPAVTFRILRDGKTSSVTVELAKVLRNKATGLAGADSVYMMGVGFSSVPPGWHTTSYHEGLSHAGTYLGVNSHSALFGTFYAIGDIGTAAKNLFNSDRGDGSTATITSVVGVAEASGDIFAAKGIPWSVKISDDLLIVAALNASLGILNLLPLLPFDGGHIAVTLAERIGRIRRRASVDVGRRIADYYTRIAPVMWAFSAVIIVFSLIVLVADVKNPVA